MRNLMNEIGPVYAPSIPLGSTMAGGTVSRVVDSGHPRFQVGDLVLANAGWKDYAVSNGDDLMPLGAMARHSQELGVLGMPAFTAYIGLLDIGHPRAGETGFAAEATEGDRFTVGPIATVQ